MKVLFIGLGSIGRRHLNVLREIKSDVEVFSYKSRNNQKAGERQEKGIRHFFSLDRAIKQKPDFAIISNPTSMHVKTAYDLAASGIPFLIEKPVSNSMKGLYDLEKIVTRKGIPVMVGFQLRFHPGYQKLKQWIENGEIGRPLSFCGYVGQYLPDWRPGIDYRLNYSSKSDQGGGVILDLCHEIDISVSLMGPVEHLNCFCGKYSDLEIDTEDIAEITMSHLQTGISNIHLNYLEPVYQWTTKLLGTRGVVTWDYGKGIAELLQLDGTTQRWENPLGYTRNSLYKDQLIHWFQVLDGKSKPVVDLNTGIMITKLCLAAKQSSNEKRQVEVRNEK